MADPDAGFTYNLAKPPPSNEVSAPPTELEMEEQEEDEAAAPKAGAKAGKARTVDAEEGRNGSVPVPGLLQGEQRNENYALLRFNITLIWEGFH